MDLAIVKTLKDLAHKINLREALISSLKKQTIEAASDAVQKAIAQGQDLFLAKSALKQGEWQDWLSAHCPEISARSARRYMWAYENRERIKLCSSMRAAVALLEEKAETAEEQTGPRSWPAFQEGMGRAWKFVEYVKRHPFSQWPNESVDALRDDLLPIAEQLWPQRFENGTSNGS